MNSVEICFYRDGKWDHVVTLRDVQRGVPALLEALETMRAWLPWGVRVTIHFDSMRKEA